jgi:hypothetical protein
LKSRLRAREEFRGFTYGGLPDPLSPQSLSRMQLRCFTPSLRRGFSQHMC